MTELNGIVLLDKSLHMTSNTALQRVKRLFKAKKAGHTGSLDPLATGMLPICFGEATKFSQFLLDSDKSYRVAATLGIKTSTGDAEGSVLMSRPVDHVTRQQIESVLPEFTGWIEQIPPMYSALKHQGKPLYRLARQGIEIERPARSVRIDVLELTSFNNAIFEFDVQCSKGTYIRTLVEDIGERLGCGAHVSQLHRLMVSPYHGATMHTLSSMETLLQEKGLTELQALLLPVETAVEALPSVFLSAAERLALQRGQAIQALCREAGLVRLFSDGFFGIGDMKESGQLIPRRLLSSFLAFPSS